MPDQNPLPARHTLLLILLPLLATFGGVRLWLHWIGVRHVYPGGYLLHHLFTGVLLVIPAAFVLAFGPRRRSVAMLTLVVLGVGSALVLDEMTYLIMTHASDEDYVSPTSLWGGVVFVSLAVVLLVLLYRVRISN